MSDTSLSVSSVGSISVVANLHSYKDLGAAPCTVCAPGTVETSSSPHLFTVSPKSQRLPLALDQPSSHLECNPNSNTYQHFPLLTKNSSRRQMLKQKHVFQINNLAQLSSSSCLSSARRRKNVHLDLFEHFSLAIRSLRRHLSALSQTSQQIEMET